MMSLSRKILAGSTIAACAIFFAGCASEQSAIPASARMISQARGSITATAPHNGTVYVYDDTDNELVYSGKVDRNDTIHLDNKTRNIDINGRKVATRALIDHHMHEIYFNRASGPTVVQSGDTTYVHHDNGEKTTVITPDDSNGHSTVITTPSN